MTDPLSSALRIGASGLRRSQRAYASSPKISRTRNRPARRPARTPIRARSSPSRTSSTTPAAPIWSRSEHRATSRPYRVEHNPGHPAADQNGNVKLPNVDVIAEVADMHEANRSYEANVQVIKQARDMITMTIDMMRTG